MSMPVQADRRPPRRRIFLQVILFKGDGTSSSSNHSSDPGEDDEGSRLVSLLLQSSKARRRKGSDDDDDDNSSRSRSRMMTDDDNVADEASEPAEAATAAVSVQVVPVLAFEFFSLYTLRRSLNSPTQYAGLILTSSRCVEAMDKCCHSSESDTHTTDPVPVVDLKSTWCQQLIFCVGPSTANAFQTLAGLNTSTTQQPPPNLIISPEGNAQSLAQCILTEHSKSSIQLPLLYPCGTLKRDTLGNALTQAQIPFESVTVYRTGQHPDLANQISTLQTKTIAAVGKGHCNECKSDNEKMIHVVMVYVFYSPSGVQHAAPLIQNLSSAQIVAIGPTTKAALGNVAGVSPNQLYQCSTPTNEALVEVLHEIKIKVHQDDTGTS